MPFYDPRILEFPVSAGVLSLMAPEELGRLMDEHSATLVLVARQWCATPEDVVQEAFLKLSAQKKAPAHVVPWLYRVVRNGAMTAARSARRRRAHEERASMRGEPWFDPAPDLDAGHATAALRALPIELREIVIAHLWGKLTFAELAAALGCSASSAHRRYTEGLALLRETMEAPCPKNPTTPT